MVQLVEKIDERAAVPDVGIVAVGIVVRVETPLVAIVHVMRIGHALEEQSTPFPTVPVLRSHCSPNCVSVTVPSPLSTKRVVEVGLGVGVRGRVAVTAVVGVVVGVCVVVGETTGDCVMVGVSTGVALTVAVAVAVGDDVTEGVTTGVGTGVGSSGSTTCSAVV